MKKSISILLVTVILTSNSIGVKAFASENVKEKTNITSPVSNLDQLDPYNDPFANLTISRGLQSRMIQTMTGSYVNAPNGGQWIYSSGGLGTAQNGNINFDRLVYLTKQDVANILATRYNTGFWDKVLTLSGSGVASGVKNYVATSYGAGTAATFQKFLGVAGAYWTLFEVVKAVSEETNFGLLKQANDNGRGVIYEYAKQSYQGYWYKVQSKVQWTTYPSAPIPSSTYGRGTFYSN
ncbi:MAG: hypothetical protein ACRC3Y_13060 [Romboutsia sp.]|uniref:hypothetical protein n=1 Tax=Romboutsia sp. TaxID=1965302 RepID=UPI003F2D7E53